MKGIDLAEGDFHLYPFAEMAERVNITKVVLPKYRDDTSFLSDCSQPALIHSVNKKIAADYLKILLMTVAFTRWGGSR